MEPNYRRLSVAEAKKIDLVAYLSSLGFEPAKVMGNNYWYLSPFRAERTASFKVDRNLNVWYDHGLGKGGTIIDFGLEFYRCSIGELLAGLSGTFSLHQPPRQPPDLKPEAGKQITVVGHSPLSSAPLLEYLESRRIDLDIARQHCREVSYRLRGKTYFAIGFRNDKGGFELRNRHVKLSSSPKAVTSIINGADRAMVAEGFFDYLSFRTMYRNVPLESYDSYILNSTAFFQQTLPKLASYRNVGLYLDTKEKALVEAAMKSGNNFSDQSRLYRNYEDLNDFLVRSGRAPRLRL